MANINSVVLIGRFTKDPEIRYIPTTGTPVASKAVSELTTDENGSGIWKDYEVEQ